MSHRMGRKFDRHQILRQPDPSDVARNAFDIALEFALLGYVKEATELFVLFETFARTCKSSWSPGMYFAWEATGLWPDCIPAEERTKEYLGKLETERILWKRQTNSTEEGLDKLIAAATGEGRTDAWGEMQLRADDLTAALDLALYLDKREKALDVLQVFADNFNLTWLDLSHSRQAWRYLKHKALGRAIEVDETKLCAFKEEVMDTFRERLTNGAIRAFKDLPMKALVDMCNENTLNNAVWEEMDVDPNDPPTSILRVGATKEQIAECEARIGHELPDDFKEFLLLTNGMGSIWNGFYGEPRLLGTDEIHVFDASELQEEWQNASVEMKFIPDMSVKPQWTTLNRVLMINDGSDDSKYVWLLEPELGRQYAGSFFAAYQQLPPDEQEKARNVLKIFHAGKENANEINWQTCVWSPPTLEAQGYQTFREYLEIIAGDTANDDILEEEDEEGRLLHSHDIFAYQLR